MSVGPREIVVTFTTDDDVAVATRIGERSVTTHGSHHFAVVDDLDPGTEYELAVDGATPDKWLPASVRTLDQPPGELVATLATANDVHFGEVLCGLTGDPATDAIGPIL